MVNRLRLYAVCQVNDVDSRIDSEDDRLHQAHIGVAQAEVGGEGDYRACHDGSALEQLGAEDRDYNEHHA